MAEQQLRDWRLAKPSTHTLEVRAETVFQDDRLDHIEAELLRLNQVIVQLNQNVRDIAELQQIAKALDDRISAITLRQVAA